MNRIITKPDGQIEVGVSACCCPPGQRHDGQHTNAITSWYRVNNEPWSKCRSTSSVIVLAEAADSCEDFKEGVIHTYSMGGVV
jgi:hypothetical protein